MARLTYHGAEELADKLVTLGDKAKQITHHALFDGAGVVADAIKSAAQGLSVGTPAGNSETGHPYTGLTPEDKAEIVNSVGIAHFNESGDGVDTAVSFNGYVSRTEKGYPNGVPIPMLVRSIESGSSVRAKQPFVRPAVNSARSKALDAMAKVVDEEINNIMG